MMHLAACLAALLAFAVSAAAQESIVTGISTDDIALTATFEGSEVFVYGAIRREGAIPPEAGPLDIVLTLSGPERPLWVRRKERHLGIWVNTHVVRVAQTPSYYAVASTRPIKDILTETERLRWGIGMDQAVRRVGGHPTITDTSDFAEAVVRIKQGQDLYALMEREVELREQTLFSATFSLPANLVEGLYVAEFFLVRGGEVIHAGDTEITARKAGLERWIYNLSREQPLAYGLLAVAMALLTGWLAATATRFVRR
jgi:uncharacterized protein (TIGR02186 family)